MDAIPSNFQIGCTEIEVVTMPTDQEGRNQQSAHPSLPSGVSLSESIDGGNYQNEVLENEYISKGEQLLIDTNRKLDLVLEKLSQMDRRMILHEKQINLLEKKIDMHLSLGVVPEERKGKADSLDNSLSLFSPVSCLLDLENLEELARDKNYVNCVKTHIQGILGTRRMTQTSALHQQNMSGNTRTGQTYCLQIVDLFFTRFFMTQCTWTGIGIKSVTGKKIALKDFVHVIEMFYKTVHYVYPTFTKNDAESFLKQMLSHAKKRFENGPPKLKPRSRCRKALRRNILMNAESIDSDEMEERKNKAALEPSRSIRSTLDSSFSLFSPVSCLLDLENLEELAKDKNYVNCVKTHVQGMLGTRRITLQQSMADNNRIGRTYCLRIVDLFFTRFFMTQCTWTGIGIKPCTGKKIALKDFVHVIDMFYETVHYVYPTFTKTDAQSFLKQMLSHAKQRFENGPPKRKPGSRCRKTPKKIILTNTESIDSVETYERMNLLPLDIKSELVEVCWEEKTNELL
ncbi:uncharacterized protein LOC125948425 isoform X8 [Anopheles darlingi]|uniref:uncharacterized protein LOC125948425 isoform X4 n=1 Tax=Anopheles darlingi TaxID=43151 RepID=UPI0020FFFF78|nr:uncharacterized protein LOC125948425 isoform X4 [Anopheles darlingi]XP_049530387.1 uncharacterized protein LOC125948425 isoform X4 [Anopheles darlingi]XP_049530388.1 uncharacterized protein LOC125948425 isoform X5 [Anopheles darlingi]XP_049530389.1 uncharacterized protein LOC125948425 isoform X6 [Anopheles darlingi]XP_049530390.1 uncharacterized protein LOC125948425 isoform X5 [Anopheles darlingi]XP_049530391.1 uncharacterized protein LOC125948425 isoform X6 [Anopheles darlingi]XP_04953039